MTRVKICGITNLEDARFAALAGADALGFVFAKSPRKISALKAKKIISQVGPWISAVGVFVNAPEKEILKTAAFCGLSAVQLHGDESPALVKKLQKTGLRVIKSFRVASARDLKGISRYSPDAYLFDTKVAGQYGGTGRVFDWAILRSKNITRPFIISGGLSGRNVAEAVKKLPLYGVDVSSGVERSPGRKDKKLVREFIHRAKKTV